METPLTRKIKQGLTYFKLDMPTQMRTPRYAEEVWTPTGIVDLIRFEDCKDGFERKCALIHHEEFPKDILLMTRPGIQLGRCKHSNGAPLSNAQCQGCIYKRDVYKVGMRITCFEVKITLSDFHSPNGHNFHGHHNYYVVPAELVSKIRDEVPADIGIIAYYESSGSYRIAKQCIQHDVPESLQIRLLYDAMKKWVDKLHFEYWHHERDTGTRAQESHSRS